MHPSVGYERDDQGNATPIPITRDTPDRHNLGAICGQCGWGGDSECPKCKSGDLCAECETRNSKAGKAAPDPAALARYRDRLRLLLLEAFEYPNTKFFLGCLLIATGDPASQGVKMETYGKRFGVSRAAVSKLCVMLCARLGIPPSAAMKSAEAKRSYQAANRRPVKRRCLDDGR